MNSTSSTPTCPVCNGLGVVAVPPPEGRTVHALHQTASDVIRPCTVCARDGRLRWLARHSGLEPREQMRRLGAFQIVQMEPERMAQRGQARNAIVEAIQKRRGLYTFYGDFGSGKTLALQVVINELRDQLYEGYYAPFATIVDHLRQLFSANQDTSSYWERLLRVPVLALDEVSRFDDSRAWILERLFVLVDARYRQRDTCLTLFATNDDPTLAYPTDDAVGYLFSRMREGQLCELRGDMRRVAGE